MKKTIISVIVTFILTSALWIIILPISDSEEPIRIDMEEIPNITNAFSDKEASSSVTIYDKEGEWVGTGMLVETSRKAYLQIEKNRYDLEPSDVAGYRYTIHEENLYVK